ncbi:MAG: DNA-3-methyladenine glycosylase [Candidatus Niyogibacteria bacterium]|nr:DNA-3-methyladenine glycosylase [Candidatus Niyogibacteria bacterium]
MAKKGLSNGVKNFYAKSTLAVANGLLGKFLTRQIGRKKISLMITEVEAYDGFSDKASHASRGKTERNKIMFGQAGNWYVYFTYGTHWMLNIVTGPENYPAAVLIRGTDKISGPARLTKYLKVNGKINGKPADRETGLWIEDRGIKIKPSEIKSAQRIGVDYAGSYWSRRKWRFYIK